MLLMASTAIHAQIGEHRNDLAIGFNAGYIMSSVGFTPKVTQDTHTGITAGLSMRYTCEKYFKTICSISAEVNYRMEGAHTYSQRRACDKPDNGYGRSLSA